MKFDSKLITQTGDFIANNKKPLLYIGGAIAVVIVGYAVVGKVKSAINGKGVVGGKFRTQSVDSTKTSINEDTASNYAENLFQAFNYTWGTDKSSIESIFSKINSEDFKMIYNAFGKRSYDKITGQTPIGFNKWISNFTELDLVSWINEELDVTDFSLKAKIRPIITKAGFILES